MDLMINAAKKNMEVLAEMQARNEDMVRVVLDHAAKTRAQVVATNESLLNLVAQQGKMAESYFAESVKTGREAVEKQMADFRTAVASN